MISTTDDSNIRNFRGNSNLTTFLVTYGYSRAATKWTQKPESEIYCCYHISSRCCKIKMRWATKLKNVRLSHASRVDCALFTSYWDSDFRHTAPRRFWQQNLSLSFFGLFPLHNRALSPPITYVVLGWLEFSLSTPNNYRKSGHLS